MLIDVLYTVLSALPVVSHVQLFLEPYGVSQVLPSPKPFLSLLAILFIHLM